MERSGMLQLRPCICCLAFAVAASLQAKAGCTRVLLKTQLERRQGPAAPTASLSRNASSNEGQEEGVGLEPAAQERGASRTGIAHSVARKPLAGGEDASSAKRSIQPSKGPTLSLAFMTTRTFSRPLAPCLTETRSDGEFVDLTLVQERTAVSAAIQWRSSLTSLAKHLVVYQVRAGRGGSCQVQEVPPIKHDRRQDCTKDDACCRDTTPDLRL